MSIFFIGPDCGPVKVNLRCIGFEKDMAWRLSLLLNAIIFVDPTVIHVFVYGLSSEVSGGLILVMIAFVAPCAIAATVLAAVRPCQCSDMRDNGLRNVHKMCVH